ncbi:DapH/DapD/GlmU-related protein [Aeromicrobium sp. NPDC092404]|uniref:DapH/DapD/GlmU-related protein n=1 Tax=Aeromicrobium sp. NPDC092404 TaxID=3154976 RepID=UPI00343DF0FB
MTERLDHPRLGAFTLAGYDKGRGVLWQAAWFAVQNLVFGTWWFPRRFRPAVLRAFGATVGSNVTIRHRVRVLWPWKLTIGDDTWVGEDAWLLNLEPIAIGTDVCVSQGVFLCTGSHDRRSADFRYDNGPVTIEDGVWLAAQSLVLRGVTVGTASVIGARAVATRDVSPGSTIRVGTVH